MRFVSLLSVIVVSLLLVVEATGQMHPDKSAWLDDWMGFPYQVKEQTRGITLVRQDYEKLERKQSVGHRPLTIGKRTFKNGLGTHANSVIQVWADAGDPIERFTAWVGVDNNASTGGVRGAVEFIVSAGGKELFRSGVMKGDREAKKIDIPTVDVKVLELQASDGGNGPNWDHADWAEATVTTRSGKIFLVDELQPTVGVGEWSKYPFSFTYGGKPSNALLPTWKFTKTEKNIDDDRTRIVMSWTDPETGLRVVCEVVRYRDFPAMEWLLFFENQGRKDTPILEGIQAMDVQVAAPLTGQEAPYRLHRTNGAPSNPTDFEPSLVPLSNVAPVQMGGGGGRSSNKDFPFYRVDTASGALIVGVGWSGQWASLVETPDNKNLHLTAGLELTHFTLHSGEKVRMPRILALDWPGDAEESNSQFRQLIYKHYAARRDGKRLDPTSFCNTCFTRGGLWLNECNEQNQISLIKAYAPLGLEALWTDAGWFEGGWAMGRGNWTVRKDNYPNGIEPVAAAAKERGMIYGLWFEPECVMANTDIHKNHPEWILDDGSQSGIFLLNMGLPESREYFLKIVRGFMRIPGFKVYRQDFNMDPVAYWRKADAPDRQGITEIRYIEGLYKYWDTIAREFPDSLREECASGGRRIDLETVIRMHVHQDSDYWFQYDVDQGQIWGLSQYLPNNCFVGHLNTLDTYDFHSVLASSLCLGWIADDPKFDTARGRALLGRYREVRHLLTGAWYPLLPYTRAAEGWMGAQYHRADLGEGLLLVFRHAGSPYCTVQASLRGLEPGATYELIYDGTGEKRQASGRELMGDFRLTLDKPRSSDLIVYRKLK